MSKSDLVQKLNIENSEELRQLTAGSKLPLKKVARGVIIHDKTYEEAGEPFGISKHAVYEFLKRLYKKKYGEDYAKG